ncbi:thermonuclease family protein [Phormidium tenue FACHB-886]|nr:thermonuclease family protein [Phormidium tenue FACHB-886]
MTQPWKTLSQVQQQQKQQAISDAQQSQTMQLVPGSVYDGDTLQVTDGTQQIKVRLCGIDAPEQDQAMGIAARDHLRSLLNQDNGEVIVVATDVDRYGRTVAELFVKRAGSSSEEIAINAQMVKDGYAYHYAQFSSSCPNGASLAALEAQAQAEHVGVWKEADAQRPWDYRHSH